MFWKRWISKLSPGLVIAVLFAAIPPADADEGPASSGGDSTLTSVQGPVRLGDFRGKVVMLFFGYTSCPDICPLSLARIGACLSSLEAGDAQHVRGLFVTLDPGRDTAERMHQYAEFFHPGIIGLTGAKAAIDEVTARYGVVHERKSAPDSALGYTISHPDTIFLIDRDGELAGTVGHDAGKETLRRKVLDLLALRQ